MKTLLQVLVLGGVVAALVGCGDPAPSTPVAPDLPKTGATSTPAADLSSAKAQEHQQGADRR